MLKTRIDKTNLFDIDAWFNWLTSFTETYVQKVVVDDTECLYIRPHLVYDKKWMENKFKGNTQYTLSFRAKGIVGTSVSTGLRFAYTDGTMSSAYIANESVWKNYTLVSEPNKTISYICLYYNYNQGAYFDTNSIQLEEGNQATPYKPYSTEITTLYHRNLSDTSVWGKVDLGTLEWVYSLAAKKFYATLNGQKSVSATDIANLFSEKYKVATATNLNSDIYDKRCASLNGNQVQVKDMSYTNATDFKQAISGVYLWYELSTNTKPTKLELTKLRKNTSNVWDEEWEVGAIDNATGVPIVATNTIRSKNFCECVGGANYFLKCGDKVGRYWLDIIFYDIDKHYISGVYSSGEVVTAPANAKYFKISTNTGGYVYGNTYNHDISINYPSSITTYSPHYVTVFEK